ncbi:Subtilisin-like protease [Acorus gramineus]|uniref:Subtilisin-like protease n=1 Tax=Acorus gramineus TaxID=55184 RepID=A0AAV9AAX3_ACOGR|nr:Subtilisin-like protease [Acorus gramineus]
MQPVSHLLLPILLCLACSLTSVHASPPQKKTYIVQMDRSLKPNSFLHHHQWYTSAVSSVTSSDHIGAEDRIIYNYETVFHGFAARLTDAEADMLDTHHGVVAMYPETVYHLHTTRSADFLRLVPAMVNNVWSAATAAGHGDVIIGVLDTGIWPWNPSFDDTGLGPVPSRWRGVCSPGPGFAVSDCNRKVIGARFFYSGYGASVGPDARHLTPRDEDGHGTHTASTAAGAPAANASLFGYAAGTARGMAPGARVAAYKVCWSQGCFSSDILSAVDAAVYDGVDVLSISLGGGAESYARDSLAVAAFRAAELGVFITCSAGNGGPTAASLMNAAPWIATIGASTIDREFPAFVRLGDGRTFTGASLYKGRRGLSPGKQYPLVYITDKRGNQTLGSFCMQMTIDPHLVAGKIVICDRGISPRVEKGATVRAAGGAGMVLANTDLNGEELVADSHLLPSVAVGYAEGNAIKNYFRTARNPTATLTFGGTKMGVRPSPVVAGFSSRGPSSLTLEILKPDMVAPGVNILAAWSGEASPTGLREDPRRVKFNILSGTSMSCPHVAGIAALLKARHPDWSPAAIKSALMTTAYVHDNTYRPIRDASTSNPTNYYALGAGHINPSKALDPGLVYDIGAEDYFNFLCTQDLMPEQIKVFVKPSSNWSCDHSLANPGDLNYPSISAVFSGNETSGQSLTLHRTVTNIGPAVSVYTVKASPFKGADVVVQPKKLQFTKTNQKLSYKVTFTSKSSHSSPEFGGLVWRDGVRRVRSPIVVTWLS